MITVALPRELGPSGRGSLRSAVLLVGLAALVGLRSATSFDGSVDALAAGVTFAAGLLLLAWIGGWRPTRPRLLSLILGLAAGGVLVVIAVTVRWITPLPQLARAAELAPWAAVTIVVAVAEELLLRGVLFEAIGEFLGVPAAVLATSMAFALMHVPQYGWHVVPLDLGVGLWLAGVRMWSGGPGAPAVAHVVADLATWWL